MWDPEHLSAGNELSKNSLSKDSDFLSFFKKQQICFSASYKDTYGQVTDGLKRKRREIHITKAEKTHLSCAFKAGYNEEGGENKKRLKGLTRARGTGS